MINQFRLLSLAATLLWSASSLSATEPLPKVLIIADSTYQQAARDIRTDLKEMASVTYVNTVELVASDTGRALEKWDQLLGDGGWSVIHFNFGLGDLVHRAPGLKSFRAMSRRAGGVVNTSPADYERNLRVIVMRLKSTGAKLVWASTTPIRSSRTDIFEPGSETRYNAIAAGVMTESEITINDMHTQVIKLIDMKRPASADPFTFDRKPIHESITTSIKHELETLPTAQRDG